MNKVLFSSFRNSFKILKPSERKHSQSTEVVFKLTIDSEHVRLHNINQSNVVRNPLLYIPVCHKLNQCNLTLGEKTVLKRYSFVCVPTHKKL